MGELGGERSQRVESFVTALVNAGFEASVSERIRTELWEKFIVMAGWSGACTAARANAGMIAAHPETAEMMLSGVAEAAAVAKAEGVATAEDVVERTRSGFFEMTPAAAQASTLTDLEHGRRLETPWLSGTVVRLGRKHGIPTPTHAFFCAALAPHVAGAQTHG